MSYSEVRDTPKPPPPLLRATVTSDQSFSEDFARSLRVKPASTDGVIFYYERATRLAGDRAAGDLFVNADNARAFARAILEMVGEE